MPASLPIAQPPCFACSGWCENLYPFSFPRLFRIAPARQLAVFEIEIPIPIVYPLDMPTKLPGGNVYPFCVANGCLKFWSCHARTPIALLDKRPPAEFGPKCTCELRHFVLAMYRTFRTHSFSSRVNTAGIAENHEYEKNGRT